MAARFGVSVAALRQANCLEDDTIYADRGLFAPPGAAAQTAPPAVGAGGSAPMVDTPTPPTHTQPPTEEVDQCTTPFSCSTKVEKLGAAIALPNNGVLCPATVTDILIDIARAGARLSPTAESVAAGATVRFGACNFADPATTRATLIRIDAATRMPLPMFLNGQGARSFGVATWPATCVDSMLGDYRVEIVDAQETPIARTFTLRRLDPGGTSLMAVPDAGGSGSFDLYLCGQVPVSPDTVSLVLESGVIDAATNRCVRRWERIDDIPPVESGNGFVHMVLTLPLPSDEAEINCYQVTHRDTFAGAVIQIAR